MAIKSNVDFKGVPINNAYIKICRYQGDKDKLFFDVGIHTKSGEKMIASHGYQCALNLDGANPVKQAYEHLKTLPEFSNAVDC